MGKHVAGDRKRKICADSRPVQKLGELSIESDMIGSKRINIGVESSRGRDRKISISFDSASEHQQMEVFVLRVLL